MKKYLYIIPGWKETSRRKPYQSLAISAKKMGYDVIFKNVDWSKPLSSQFFYVEKNSVIFGFSLGAILARLVAQNYPCNHLILASMTQLSCFKKGKMREALVDLLGESFVEDVEKHLKTRHKAKKQTVIYGDKEVEKADILVPNTEHELNTTYIDVVSKLLL